MSEIVHTIVSVEVLRKWSEPTYDRTMVIIGRGEEHGRSYIDTRWETDEEWDARLLTMGVIRGKADAQSNHD